MKVFIYITLSVVPLFAHCMVDIDFAKCLKKPICDLYIKYTSQVKVANKYGNPVSSELRPNSEVEFISKKSGELVSHIQNIESKEDIKKFSYFMFGDKLIYMPEKSKNIYMDYSQKKKTIPFFFDYLLKLPISENYKQWPSIIDIISQPDILKNTKISEKGNSKILTSKSTILNYEGLHFSDIVYVEIKKYGTLYYLSKIQINREYIESGLKDSRVVPMISMELSDYRSLRAIEMYIPTSITSTVNYIKATKNNGKIDVSKIFSYSEKINVLEVKEENSFIESKSKMKISNKATFINSATGEEIMIDESIKRILNDVVNMK